MQIRLQLRRYSANVFGLESGDVALLIGYLLGRGYELQRPRAPCVTALLLASDREIVVLDWSRLLFATGNNAAAAAADLEHLPIIDDRPTPPADVVFTTKCYNGGAGRRSCSRRPLAAA